jgi:hypothetical protein
MESLGFWNLIIIAFVTVILRQYIKGDREIKELQNSKFMQHPLPQKILHFFQHPLIKLVLQIALILIISRWLIYTGWVAYRLTQQGAPFWDFKQFYVVSHIILEKMNPYDLAVYENAQCQWVKECYQGSFIYFPNILPFIWFLGYLSLEKASTIWVAIHLVAIVLLIWGSLQFLESKSRLMRMISMVACALIYGVVFDLRAGNISSIVAALVVWCLVLAKRDRNVAAGILLGISTIKPTISALFFLYFLFKKRWKILGLCLITSLFLISIGLGMTGSPLGENIQLYQANYDWVFQHHPSGDPFIAPARIDLGVIGPRLLPDFPSIAKLLSRLLAITALLLVCQFLYKQQRTELNSQQILLAEVTLIACLSLLIFYSQRHTTAILVLAVVFFINYLIREVREEDFSRRTLFLWTIGGILLLSQSGILYHHLLEPLEVPWKKGGIPYLTRVTIGTLPNYLLFGLLVVIWFLATRHLLLKRRSE